VGAGAVPVYLNGNLPMPNTACPLRTAPDRRLSHAVNESGVVLIELSNQLNGRCLGIDRTNGVEKLERSGITGKA